MAYRNIVVHLAQDGRSAARLQAAVELAERHDGRVTGVYVLPRFILPGFASFELSPEVVKRLDTEQRALSDALPLLKQASKVIVLGVDTGDGKHIPGADVSAHLARHGVSAEARHIVSSSDLSAGDALLSEISDLGAGLLVMGGYGHHRMRELLLGGVTRDILRQMTVPVLMSH